MSSRYDVIGPNTLEAMRRDAEITTMQDRIEQLEAALKEIVSQETPYSNATVRRIVKLARAALGEKKDER